MNIFTFRVRAFLFGLTLALAPMSAFAQSTNVPSTDSMLTVLMPLGIALGLAMKFIGGKDEGLAVAGVCAFALLFLVS